MLARRAAWLWLLVIVSSASADETFPYRATVTLEDLNVRSGPGETYYPVMKLKLGDIVEVFRHDPGGWHAIRPPVGSFSWIAGEFIERGEGNTGRVVGNRVVSRIGSVFSDIRDVIQVRLGQDEEVEILDQHEQNTPEGLKTWYKIAPPAGEFRWVASKFLAPQSTEQVVEPPRTSVAPTASHTPASVPPTTRVAAPSASPPVADKPAAPESQELLAKLQEVQKELEALKAAGPRDGWVSRGQSSTTSGNTTPSNSSTAFTSPPVAKTIAIHQGNVPYAIDQLELQVAEVVSRDTSLWDFRDVTAQAERVLAVASTEAERQRTRNLLTRVEKFDDIRKRTAQVTAQRLALEEASRTRTASRAASNSQIELRDPLRKYDGTGRLAEVVSQKTGAPQFALVNSTGEVQFYVTPAPGVNLRPFLGREIGVTGIMGYLPEQRMRHVTAKRVEELDAAKIR